jgi:hypothetical protein
MTACIGLAASASSVMPAEGEGDSPTAGTQGQGLGALHGALGPGYFADAKFRDDSAARRVSP